MAPETDTEVRDILAAAIKGTLTRRHVERLAAIDVELLKLALLTAAKRVAEQHAALNQKDARIAEKDARIADLEARLRGPGPVHPSTPSSQRPVYAKPPAPKRKRKSGARPGHVGARRPEPEQIDLRQEHRLDACPGCGGPLQTCSQVRARTIEDILADLRTLVTEHTIHRDYCPACKKHVEPIVPDALPKAALGHRVVALTAWLHYGLGVTIAQVIAILGHHLRTHLSGGGLAAMWLRIARILEPWYEQIAQEAKASAVLHADETGCRVNGQTWWLWCFANGQVCYYMIHSCPRQF